MKVKGPPSSDARTTAPARVTGAMSEREMRSARVTMLAAAVKNGTYLPDPGLIAERMLDDTSFLEGVALELGRQRAEIR